jgi:hypothetical protein
MGMIHHMILNYLMGSKKLDRLKETMSRIWMPAGSSGSAYGIEVPSQNCHDPCMKQLFRF